MLRVEGPHAGWSAAAQWSWTSTAPAAAGLGSDPSCSTHAALLTYHWCFCCINSTMFTCYQNIDSYEFIHLSVCLSNKPIIHYFFRPTNQTNNHLFTYISVCQTRNQPSIGLTNQPSLHLSVWLTNQPSSYPSKYLSIQPYFCLYTPMYKLVNSNQQTMHISICLANHLFTFLDFSLNIHPNN